MMYRVYLRSIDQRVVDKTTTGDRAAAAAAFASLVDRRELDGSRWLAVLNYNGAPVAHHRYDRGPEDADYWRGRIAEIAWPPL